MNKRVVKSNVIATVPFMESGMRSSIATLHTGLFLIAMLFCSSVFAWGFGDLQLQSALGQAFRGQVNLLGSDSGSIERHCFSASLTSYDGVPLGRLILDIKDGSSDIKISGVPPVNEPAAKFILTHVCKPKMQREYAILLDPPIGGNLAAVAAAPSTKTTSNSRQLNNLPATAAGEQQVSEKPKKSRNREASNRAQTLAVDENISPQVAPEPAPAKKRKKEKPAVAAAPVNVLRLGGSDSAVTDVPGGSGGLRLAMTYGLSGLIPTPAADLPPHMQAPALEAAPIANEVVAPPAPALQELLQKINVLESKTEELRKLNATQLLALQEAKKEPPIKTSLIFLYLLLFACVLAIGWLVWRMRQIRTEGGFASWQKIVPENDQPYDAQMESRHFPAPAASDAFDDSAIAVALADNADALPGEKKLGKPPVVNGEQEFDENFYSHDKPKIATAEELCDETQEAEFWVHINQPLRAIEILEAKSSEDNPTSPLPWLNLFDLYRVVGDKEKYEALGKRFMSVFNGRIVPWDEPLTLERPRGIEDFPEVMGRIVQLWPTDALLPFMEKLLIDEREGNRDGFDLAAFRDILFLTNIAHKIQLSKKFEKPPAAFPNWSIL